MKALFNLIICLTIFQAVIFFFIFIFSRKRNLSLILLGIYLITIVGPGLHFLLDNFNIKAVYEFPANFYLLSPPIFYLYTKSILGIISKKDVKHLILGIIEFIIFFILFLFPHDLGSYVYNSIIIPNKLLIFTVIIPIYSVSYLLASIFTLKKYKLKVEEYYSANEEERLNWIYVTNIISIFLYVIDTAGSFITIKFGVQFNILLISGSGIAFIVYWISIYGLNQKSLILNIEEDKIRVINNQARIQQENSTLINNENHKLIDNLKSSHTNITENNLSSKEFYEQRQIKEPVLMEEGDSLFVSNNFQDADYLKPSESEDKSITIDKSEFTEEFHLKYQKLVTFLEETKIYKDKEINLFRIAELVQLSYRDVSKSINTVANKNFNQFLNEFRVKEAMRLIKEDSSQKYNLSWIAEEVGFNSRSTFFSVFKAIVGMTPNEFKKSN